MEYLLCAVLLLSALVQGGFYPTVFLLCGAVLAAVAAFRPGGKPRPAEYALWGLSLLYLASALGHGFDLSTLARACLPAVCACFLRLSLTVPDRERLWTLLLAGTGILAGIGMLALSGLLPLPGAVTAGRLQFPFQYANAAGSWFAAAALLGQEREKRPWFLPTVTALLLTRSVGAVALYALAQLARLPLRREEWRETLTVHAAAGAFALALPCVPLPADLALIALLYAAGWRLERLALAARRLRLHWLALAALAAGGVLLLRSRPEALGTLAERLAQIVDGLRVARDHPLLGVGPGNWELYYPFYQTVQYVSSVIHCGPVQAAVDAGIPAALSMAVFLVLAWRDGKRTLPQKLAAGLLALHSLLDFTMQFFPICALLLLLLFPGERRERARRPLQTAASLAACALFLLSLAGELSCKQLAYAAQREDWEEILSRWESPLCRGAAAGDYGVRALYETGRLDQALAATEETPLSYAKLQFRARALAESGQVDAACALLLEQLSRQPRRVALYEFTAGEFARWDPPQSCFDEYNRLARLANDTVTTLGVRMGNQVAIEYIKKGDISK